LFFQPSKATPSLDHLSVADKKTYEENMNTLQTLKNDLKEKTQKYKDNPSMYDRTVPQIELTIQEVETENQNLLDGKVRFDFFIIHSKLQIHN
jgi:heme oxygenase